MPIVSVNLSPKAYHIYHYLSMQRKASMVLSTLLVNWDEAQVSDEPSAGPILMPGDIRRMFNGDLCQWTHNGWNLLERGEEE